MKNTIFLVILFVLLSRLSSYSQWVQTNGPEGQSPIFALAKSGNDIYAASIYGFYWSTNNGTNWIRTSSTFPTDTIILSSIGNTIFAADRHGVTISTDHGYTWTLSNNGLPVNPAIYCLTVDTNVMFVGTSNGIYRSTDYGSTWLSTQSPTNKIIKIAVGSAYLLAADTLNVYKSVNNGLNWSTYIFHSTYNIQDLAICNNTAFASTGMYLYYSTNSGTTWLSQTYWNIESFCVNGTSILRNNGVGGISISTNCGSTWTSYSNFGSNTIIPNGPNCFIASIAGSYSYAPGTQGVFFSTDNGLNWTCKNSGLLNSTFKYILSSGNNVICGSDGEGLIISTNQGANWNNVRNCRVYSIASEANRILSSTTAGLLFSTNNGTTWDSISNMPIPSLHFVGTDIFAGGCGGSGPPVPIYLSRDTAHTWTTSNLWIDMACGQSIVNIDSNIFVSAGGWIFLSTNYGSTWDTGMISPSHCMLADTISGVFAGGGNSSPPHPGLIRSTNNGQSWFPANSGISSSAYINSLIFNDNDMYAGTNIGVYKSTNQGSAWFQMNSGFPPGIYISSLAVNGNYLYAASYWNGVWKYPLLPAGVKPIKEDELQTIIYPNPFKSSATIQYSVIKKSFISIKLFDIHGKEIETLLFKEQNPGKYRINVSTQDMESGIYFYRIISEHSTEVKKIIVIN